MKIYLLNPPFLPNYVRCGRWQGAAARSGGMDYPKWLAYATAALETKFDDVRLVDAPASKKTREDVIKDVANYQPDLIVAESNFSSLNNDIDVIKKLKETVPGAVTVIAGPPAAKFADFILRQGGTDIVARYEYDYTVLAIACVLEARGQMDSVTGISFIKDGEVRHNPDREYTTSEDLDRIPFVSRVYKKHLNVRDYYLSQSLYPQVQIFTGRGCPNQCTFCSWPMNLMGRKYRVRSVDGVLDEFEYIAKELPFVKEVFIEDDTFTIDKKRIAEFCHKKMERGLKGTWSCNSRATLDLETMKLMKKSGCRLLIVGFESGSEEILKTIKKGVSIERMKQFTRDAKKARLMVHGDFIIGLPGETKETAEQTLRLIKELKPNILQVAVATPLPGTEFYDSARKHGHILVDDLNESIDASGFQKCILSYPEFTRKDIETYVTRALKEYYLSPSFVPIAVSNVLRKNGLHELKSMMMSARTFFRYMGGRSNAT